MKEYGGVKPPSYRNVVVNETKNSRASRSPFEPLPHLRDQFLYEETDRDKGTGMDAESLHPKASRIWITGKCIPQAPIAPKYVIKSTRVGEHTQFMREHTLIGKFIGLWPSEKDLA